LHHFPSVHLCSQFFLAFWRTFFTTNFVTSHRSFSLMCHRTLWKFFFNQSTGQKGSVWRICLQNTCTACSVKPYTIYKPWVPTFSMSHINQQVKEEAIIFPPFSACKNLRNIFESRKHAIFTLYIRYTGHNASMRRYFKGSLFDIPYCYYLVIVCEWHFNPMAKLKYN